MKPTDLLSPSWNRGQLERETLRVFDICDGCRRCFNLCPSFNTLLDRIDGYESEVSRFSPHDFEQVEQECYYCKLCFNHCPYTPPHSYGIDFPRLMTAWKRQRVTEGGASWRDRLLVHTDLIGRLGSLTAPLTNWALQSPFVRRWLERFMEIHRARRVLPYQRQPFRSWWKQRSAADRRSHTNGKVALFPSCLVEYQATDIGKATVQVLEHNGIEVVVPDGQQCCGMPYFDLGDFPKIAVAAKANSQIFQPYLEEGYDIVAPVASCSLMLKREYPSLLPQENLKRLAAGTFDICEYLMRLNQSGKLSLDFQHVPRRIGYQIPCHLRDQNIGFKSKELLALTGADVHLIEKCSGHDGTWSAKVEFFDLSMRIAKKAIRELEDPSPDLVASDCPLSALQLDQARGISPESSRRALHPIEILRNAYSLS